MYTYIARRLILTIFILFSLSIIVFVSMRAIPGGLAEIMLGIEATPESVAALEKSMGLDKPIYVQFLKWLSQVVQGNLGDSLRTGRPVLGEILYRIAGNPTGDLLCHDRINRCSSLSLWELSARSSRTPGLTIFLRPLSIVGLSVPSILVGNFVYYSDFLLYSVLLFGRICEHLQGLLGQLQGHFSAVPGSWVLPWPLW